MAVDNDLNQRFRKAVGVQHKKLVEKRMMGGICFMWNGNMLGGADRHAQTQYGRFLFRVGKDNEREALLTKSARVVEQGGRKMGGMIFVDADLLSDSEVKALVKLAMKFVGKLPSK